MLYKYEVLHSPMSFAVSGAVAKKAIVKSKVANKSYLLYRQRVLAEQLVRSRFVFARNSVENAPVSMSVE